MKLNNIKNSKGFTIVELLIVIIIIGILAALVLNSFRGVQERARDTERQTDINAQQAQLEVFYTDNGGYPPFSDVSSDLWIKGALKGADLAAWRTPNNNDNANTEVNAAGGTTGVNKDTYGYASLNDDNTECTTDTAPYCPHYKLYWYTENNPALKEKDSLN